MGNQNWSAEEGVAVEKIVADILGAGTAWVDRKDESRMVTKASFLTGELEILSWNASVQRATVYKQGIKPHRADVTAFRRAILAFITTELLPLYSDKVTKEALHYENIEKLIAHANHIGRGVLRGNRYKYGVAQKLLNLILKYQWCRGLVSQPPHCPVDRIIMHKAGIRGINWTQITQRSEYVKVIEAIKEVAVKDGVSIAQWELRNYNRR